jgi:SAM-dependent methyltransferase
MTLVNLDFAEPLLASPCCRKSLERAGGSWTCRQCSMVFEQIADWPVLVDFDDSILQRTQIQASAAASVVLRRANPRWRRALQPGNRAAANNIGEFVGLLPKDAVVLVVGGGALGEGLKQLYSSDINLVAFDIYGSQLVQVIGDAHRIPFHTSSFNGVIIQAVLEHVLEPSVVVSEIWRVLCPDGLVYAETPFLQPVHEGAYDFQRFTDSGHRWLFRNFVCIDSGTVGGVGTQFLWSLNYLVRGIFRSRFAGLLARTIALPLRGCDRFVDSRYSIDAAAGVYFLGRRSETVAVTASDMLEYYKGAQ